VSENPFSEILNCDISTLECSWTKIRGDSTQNHRGFLQAKNLKPTDYPFSSAIFSKYTFFPTIERTLKRILKVC